MTTAGFAVSVTSATSLWSPGSGTRVGRAVVPGAAAGGDAGGGAGCDGGAAGGGGAVSPGGGNGFVSTAPRRGAPPGACASASEALPIATVRRANSLNRMQPSFCYAPLVFSRRRRRETQTSARQ